MLDNKDIAHPQIQKLGRTFALSPEIEQRVVNYIIDMQELGFGLTVLQVFNMFNPVKKVASKWW